MYARFQAEMARVEDGVTRRDALEASARRGNPLAIKALTEPVFPEPIGYLWQWLLEIRQGLGEMGGLTWGVIRAWQKTMHRSPRWYDVEALFLVNAALQSPALPDSETPTDG